MMLQVKRARSAQRNSLRAAARVGACILLTVTLASCQNSSAGSITLDQEVLLRGKPGTPFAIIQMPDGGFVIAGNMGAAWAVRTGPQGQVRWQFKDDFGDLGSYTSQSEFKGAVALANGNVLLCGSKNTHEGTFGLLVVIDPEGNVLERRKVFPSRYGNNSGTGEFNRCQPWADGIALLGTGRSRSGGASGWLIKLDKNAQPLWEKLDPALPSNDMTEIAGQNLLLSGRTDLVRLDAAGTEIARRSFTAYGLDLLRTLKPSKSVTILRYGEGQEQGKVFLTHLDDQLKNIGPDQPIGPYRVNFGRGYVLDDSSVVLFGQVELKPAMIKLGGSGTVEAVTVYPVDLGSFAVRDATPLSAAQFVTVRTQNVFVPNKNGVRGAAAVDAGGIGIPDFSRTGIVMTWVTFKK
jgi:hypothetical protein